MNGLHHVTAIAGKPARNPVSTHKCWVCGWSRKRSILMIPELTIFTMEMKSATPAQLLRFFLGKPPIPAGWE